MKKLLVLSVLMFVASLALAQDLPLISRHKNFNGAFDSIYVSPTYRWTLIDVVHVSGTDTLHICLNADTAATQKWYCIPGTTTSIPAAKVKYVRVRTATGGTVNAIIQIK